MSATVGINQKVVADENGETTAWLEITFKPGTYPIKSYTVSVDGVVTKEGAMTDTVLTNGLRQALSGSETQVIVEVIDESGESVKQPFTKFPWAQ